jgi:hypothetical protein
MVNIDLSGLCSPRKGCRDHYYGGGIHRANSVTSDGVIMEIWFAEATGKGL